MPDRRTTAERPDREQRRILIVEDEPIIVFALEDIIEALGHTVVAVASTIDQALQWLEREVPDLAILDVNLNGAKSYPVADRMRELQAPYIFATGYGASEHPPEHKDVFTLTKPFAEEAVKEAIDAY